MLTNCFPFYFIPEFDYASVCNNDIILKGPSNLSYASVSNNDIILIINKEFLYAGQ